jgi:aldehyde dehydrogenase (NAD+)
MEFIVSLLMDINLRDSLLRMQQYFRNYQTYNYEFRKMQLQKLKSAILKHEKELHDALYADLKKNAEESWVTETGFLMAEIRHTLKHLRSWMKPERVATNLLNWPSKSRIYKEPLGVVLIIGPWNYPLQLLFAPLIGAIAAGNCIVLKPSEFAPATSMVMKKIIEENFQNEYILYVQGEGAELVPAMMNNFRFNHVFYTGSTDTGRKIYEMAAKQLVPVTLELGGKSPCVVDEDANLEVAARRIALTKFSNAGQMCVAPDYLLVHERVRKEFTGLLIEKLKQFYSDDALRSYNYGKIINQKQFKRLVGYLKEGRIAYGGEINAAENYIAPTIIEDVSIESAMMNEEIFGPVLPIISFRNFEEAKSIIDRNPDPLAFYIFTRKEREEEWLEKISFGGGCVNNVSWHLTNFNLPFGGRGNSGTGAYHGKFSFDVFSHKKAVLKTPVWFDPSVKYPPYKGKLGLFKKVIR